MRREVSPILDVRGLHLSLRTRAGAAAVLRGLDLSVGPGEIVGLVGESGCGKSIFTQTMLGLLPPGSIDEQRGQILFRGVDLALASDADMRAVRGSQIGMVFQDPSSYLNPVQTIESQVGAILSRHTRLGPAARRGRIRELLARVQIDDPERVARSYPHQLSGGMRQRVLIAAALSCGPGLVIADEPTTALDVTVQAQILDLLRTLSRELDFSLLLITHDFGVVAETCDRVFVMRAGAIVETNDVYGLFASPGHAYTRELLGSIRPDLGDGHGRTPRPAVGTGSTPGGAMAGSHPALRSDPGAAAGRPLLQVRDLRKDYGPSGIFPWRRGRSVTAVDGVSFSIRPGETLALVGESGCGKSTLGRLILRLLEPTSGEIDFDGRALFGLDDRGMKGLRTELQMVFQDPIASLNPRKRVEQIIGQPLRIHRVPGDHDAQIDALLADVELLPTAEFRGRLPHELSGGQRQRVAIARALALGPRLIVADEPVSSLDVSIRRSVLRLLKSIQVERGIAYLFVTHDLSVASAMADRIAVMYLGRLVEIGTAGDIASRPLHPYTQALMAAAPVADPRLRPVGRRRLAGDAPRSGPTPQGCRFCHRCPRAMAVCETARPALDLVADGHGVACHFPAPLIAAAQPDRPVAWAAG